jgi:hypothetical protein
MVCWFAGQSVQSDEDDETMFFDAVENSDLANEFTVDVPISAHRRTSSGISTDSQVRFADKNM